MIGAVPVLMYHHVTPASGLVTVSPKNFEVQMAYLAEHGYRTLRADELLAFIQGQLTLRQPSVFITFDDGYLDNFLYAYPLLKRFNLSATIFGITGWIGDGSARALTFDNAANSCPNHSACMEAIRQSRHDEVMLRWPEVEKMVADGSIELHSHTHTHTRWDRVVPSSAERQIALRDDLEKSRAAIKSRLGIESHHLCWPEGHYDEDYQHVARAVGFKVLYTTKKNIVAPGSDPTAVGRIVVKDRADSWFARRLWLYSRPTIGKIYTFLRAA